MPVDECIEVYIRLSSQVFRKQRTGLRFGTQPTFSSSELRQAIEQVAAQVGLSAADAFDGGRHQDTRT